MVRTLAALAIAFLLPLSAFATTGDFVGGYKSCYQYGVDMPTVQIFYSGAGGQGQVQLNSVEDDVDRFVAEDIGGPGPSPYSSVLDFSRQYDASPTLGWFDFDPGTVLPYHVTDLKYYAASDGLSADVPVDFVIQSGPCSSPPPSVSTSSIFALNGGVYGAPPPDLDQIAPLSVFGYWLMYTFQYMAVGLFLVFPLYFVARWMAKSARGTSRL